MRVLHLNYSDLFGGAAISVFRLNKALKQINDLESNIKVSEKISSDKNIIGPKSSVHIALNILKKRFSFQIKKLLKIKGKYYKGLDSCSIAILPTKIKKEIKNLNPDILHLHWINNEMISIKEIGEINIPKIWTFADMWPFCGAEHYTFENRFEAGYFKNNKPINQKGFDLNKWVWERKKKNWKNKFQIVCISNWLSDMAKKSALFKDFDIQTIPCCIDCEEWKPIEKYLAKKILGIDEKSKVLFFSASNGTDDYRKGFDIVKEIIKDKFYKENNITLFVLGKISKKDLEEISLNVKVKNLDNFYYGNSLILRLIYSSSDVFLIPSRLEAFGQTVIEAGACETPAIGFANTGVADTIEHRKTGYLAKYLDYNDFSNGIKWTLNEVLSQNDIGKIARLRVKEKFSYELVSNQYYELYKKLKNNN
jgi:glycosyltransferase involved in cell wall biosynthesis